MSAFGRDTTRSLVALAGGLDTSKTEHRRWTSTPVGDWEVNASSQGVDVWTHPVDPLTPKQAAALGDALRAAGGAS